MSRFSPADRHRNRWSKRPLQCSSALKKVLSRVTICTKWPPKVIKILFIFFSQSHLGILPIQIIFLQVTCRSSGLMRLCLRTFAMCSTSNRFISATTRNRSHFETHRLGSTAPEGSASATIGRSNSTRPANAIRPPNGQLLQLGKRRTQQWFSDIYRVIATAHTVRESWETKERKKTL